MADKEIFTVTEEQGILIVVINQTSIGGIAGVEQVGESLRTVICERQPHQLIIDFSSVRFFSSQMLGLLVDIWRRMKDTGGTLLISGINPQLTRVFRITHLDKIFDFYRDTQAAVEALRS